MITPSSDPRFQEGDPFQTPTPVKRRGLRLGYIGIGLLIVAVVGVVLGAYLVLGQKPSVHALIRVMRQHRLILTEGGRLTPEETDRRYEAYRQTIKIFLRGRDVLQAALNDPQVVPLVKGMQKKDAVLWLEKNLRAEYLDNSEVLRVSFEAGTPEERVVILNAIVESFVKVVVKREQDYQNREVKTLHEFVRKSEAKLRQAREEYDTLSEALGTRGKTLINQEFIRGQLAEVMRELRRVHLAQTAGRVKLARLKEKATPQKDLAVAKLEEEFTILVAQAKVLNEEKENLLKQTEVRIRKSSKMEDLENQIARTEQVLRKAALRKEEIEANQVAPPRVRVIGGGAIMEK